MEIIWSPLLEHSKFLGLASTLDVVISIFIPSLTLAILPLAPCSTSLLLKTDAQYSFRSGVRPRLFLIPTPSSLRSSPTSVFLCFLSVCVVNKLPKILVHAIHYKWGCPLQDAPHCHLPPNHCLEQICSELRPDWHADDCFWICAVPQACL